MANYKINKNKTFINPYNFVPINSRDDIVYINKEEKSSKSSVTGRLHCELIVKTPLVMPDTTKKEEPSISKHYEYPSFKVGEDYVIPGSSIRGMLRSVYEAATNSCMVTMDADEHLTRRVGANKAYKPCVLKKTDDGWRLYEAERFVLKYRDKNKKDIEGGTIEFKNEKKGKVLTLSNRGNKSKECEEIVFGDAVTIEEKIINRKKIAREIKKIELRERESKYYFFLGEACENKKAESVFKIGEKCEDVKAEQIIEAFAELENTLLMYRSESINKLLSSDTEENKRHYGYRGYEEAKRKGIVPLWYKTENDHLYLSLSAVGRVAYNKKMSAISNGHEPCTSREKLCPACSIFGMIGTGDSNKGFGSAIRITDAIGSENVTIDKRVTLKELGSPKTSYLPFYSEEGKEFDEAEAYIRGRKFYWHNPKAASDKSVYVAEEKTKRNGTFDLIRPESRFKFDVYYDSLTEDQLKMLKWVIELPSERSLMLHKLGHGKPLGLGSVQLVITEDKSRVLKEGYKLEDTNNYEADSTLIHEKSWEILKELLTYEDNCEGSEIRYPYISIPKKTKDYINKKFKDLQLKENVVANHQWFKWFKKDRFTLPKDKTALPTYDLSYVTRSDFKTNSK